VLRQFAVLCLVVFGALGAAWFWQRGGVTTGVAIAMAGVAVGLVGVVQPAAIRWIYSGWIIAVFPIGWTISRLMLAALFYLVFTPVAIVFRIIRRDALRLRRPEAPSLWTPKPGASSADQYFRQF
jgi:hypothetical protein